MKRDEGEEKKRGVILVKYVQKEKLNEIEGWSLEVLASSSIS